MAILKCTLTFFLSMFFGAAALAQDVTLSWDPSPTAGVTGYNVYYKTGDMNFPFDGTGADQGASPVDVGDVLSTTLTGLADGVTYYFSVTAYDDGANQSSYSNIVSTSWLPALLAPENNESAEPIPVTFRWETAPAGYSVSYTLYYGTAEQEVREAGDIAAPLIPPADRTPLSAGPAFLPLILTALLLLRFVSGKTGRNRFKPASAVTTIALCAFITACSGGGGGGSETSDRAVGTTPPADEPSVLYSIDKDNSDYHQAFDLESGTTYYWKVVATDTNDSNLVYESQVQSFTTEKF